MPKRRKKQQHWTNKITRFIAKLILVILMIAGISKFSSTQTNDNPTSKTLATQVQQVTQYHFIRTIAPIVKTTSAPYHLLSSITLAQACLESDFGQSSLASQYHNLFGVKAYGDVPKIKLDTKEFVNGKWITISGSFRVYENDTASIQGHARLLANGTTWNPKQYAAVLQAKDYKTAANAHYTSGYATDPTYAKKIIAMIETYHLDQYDAKTPPTTP